MSGIQQAILAGICFGSWPLLMNRSGLEGASSSVVISLAVLIGVLPLAIYQNGLSIPQTNWTIVIISGIFGALGMLTFTSMLSSVSIKNVGLLMVIMTLTQIGIAAVYQTFVTNQLPWDKSCGYGLAAIAAYLLLR